jgi:hypothetical protein
MISRGNGREVGDDVLAGAVQRGVSELLQQGVGFPVGHAMFLMDGRAAQGLREMALARAGRPEEEHIFALLDEMAGRELVRTPTRGAPPSRRNARSWSSAQICALDCHVSKWTAFRE